MEAIIKTAFLKIETSVDQLKLKLAKLNDDSKAKEVAMLIEIFNNQTEAKVTHFMRT